jgi:hypothetical protein
MVSVEEVCTHITRHKKSNVTLKNDVNNLLSGLRAAVLIDYMDTNPKILEKYLKLIHNSIRLLTVTVSEIELHYIIHSGHLIKQLTRNNDDDVIFINADPSLMYPCIIESTTASKLYSYLKSMSQILLSSLRTSLFHIKILLEPREYFLAIDTALVNGWLLNYPYIYVRLSILHGLTKTEDNCLVDEPLNVFEVNSNGNIVSQFTVPVRCCDNDHVSNWIAKQMGNSVTMTHRPSKHINIVL